MAGERCVVPEYTLQYINLSCFPDLILNALIDRARDIIVPYQDPAKDLPDPSFVLQLPDEVYTGSNLYAIQKSFDGRFQFDVYFESGSSKQKLSCMSAFSSLSHLITKWIYTATTLDQGIPALVASYSQRFQSIFPYPRDYPTAKQPSLEAFSKAITSNLVGGVGYFYGTSIVNRRFSYEWDEDEDTFQSTNIKEEGDAEISMDGAKLTEPKALLTATPSRSFFPRGFYW